MCILSYLMPVCTAKRTVVHCRPKLPNEINRSLSIDVHQDHTLSNTHLAASGYLDSQQGSRPLLEGLKNVGFHQRGPCPLAHNTGAPHTAHSWTGPVKSCLHYTLCGAYQRHNEHPNGQQGLV